MTREMDTAERRPRRRVLVVEDDRSIRELLVELLSEEGHDVRVAVDAAEALEVARRLRPELILLDMRLSLTSGHSFLGAYRAEFGQDGAAVVVMSGLMGLHGVRGADAVLSKPFTLDQVLRAVGTTRDGADDRGSRDTPTT